VYAWSTQIEVCSDRPELNYQPKPEPNRNYHTKLGTETWIPAETEITHFTGTETGTEILVSISAGTGTEPNFGRSLEVWLFSYPEATNWASYKGIPSVFEVWLLISGLPKCLGENHLICDYVRRLLNYGAYTHWIQKMLVQAQYWHDPLDEQSYRENSLFLADINNDRATQNTRRDILFWKPFKNIYRIY